MRQISKFIADDGTEFTDPEACLQHEREQSAGKALAEAYDVAVRTGRAEALMIAMVKEPEGALAALALLNPPTKSASQSDAEKRRVRSDAELKQDVADFIKTKGGKASMTSIYKGVGASLHRMKSLLETTACFRKEDDGNKWSVIG